METNEGIEEKLKYIGLDLENVPEIIAGPSSVSFRIKRNYDEKSYKVYKYVNVNDIVILLTPTHRLADYTEKYAKALPIAMFFNPVHEEDMLRYTAFLNMVKSLQIEDLKEIEEQQQQFKSKIPDSITYGKDYLWQIYYAEDAHKYFVLFPTKEHEVATLFYILKKQIENNNEKIYVPICYATYSRKYLYESEIADVENYLCFFTKEWPLIHEVYDIEGNSAMQIMGRTYIYDNLQSEYKITLKTEQEAREFYQLLKALFILETQLSHHYKFTIKLDNQGSIYFYYNSEKITFSKLPDMIKQEYLKGIKEITKIKEIKVKLSKELKKLKKEANNLNEEYYEKEKQISIFLECKKTFFGKIKYFFKYKKIDNSKKITSEEKKKEEQTGTLKYFEKLEIKEHYNLETLLNLYESLDVENNDIRNLEQDIEAMHQRINMLELKIKNANQYIKEIDKHKKSIFEFWRFTNKPEAQALNEGTETPHEKRKMKIKKTFNYITDLEDIGKQFDKETRNVLSKEETDSIFIATTEIFKDINLLLNNQDIPEEHLNTLKEKLIEENKNKTVDIFGSIAESQEKIKTLGNIRHRENEKNKFPILHLKESTTLEEYKQILQKIIETIDSSIKKFKTSIDIPVYMVGELKNKLNIFYINPEEALAHSTKTKENLYKLNLTEGTNCLPLTNIIYYNNENKTLPLGMMISTGILLNTDKLNFKKEEKDTNYKIKFYENEIKSVELDIYKYDI